MKRKILLYLYGCYACLMMAQQTVVTGVVVTEGTTTALPYATAALLAEGKAIGVATTNEEGRFFLTAPAGRYQLRLSYIGTKTLTKMLSVQGDTLRLDTLRLESTEQTLAAALVAAKAAKVQQVGDTTQFNASAYRVPPGSSLEALIKQLPGVKIEEDGSITWNGKKVNEFLINGKDLFKGDTRVAMKNLPTDLISKVKAYDRKSDYTEMTGIDDGEEVTVLDFATKRALDNTWTLHLDLAGGTKTRYSNRLFLARFTPQSSLTLFGEMNNTNGQNFGSARGRGNQQGLTTQKGAGFNYTWDNGKKRRRPGFFGSQFDFRYGHTNNDVVSRSSTEHFLTLGSNFMESIALRRSGASNVNANGHIEWQPDSMTFLSVRPSFSYTSQKERGSSKAANFNGSPGEVAGVQQDLLYEDQQLAALDAITLNRSQHFQQGSSNAYEGRIGAFAMRRLDKSGRNVGFRGSLGFSRTDKEDFSLAHIRYLSSSQQQLTHSYNTQPLRNWDYHLRLSYAEPLGRNWFAEVAYQYEYRYAKNDLSRYDLEQYAAWHDLARFGLLPTTADSLLAVRDNENSQYATYRFYHHRPSLGVRYNTEKLRLGLSIDFTPQRTSFHYYRPAQLDTVITREVFYVSPRLRMRYQWNKNTRLQAFYRGSARQPSMTQLLSVVDSNDPLNITVGNPTLKPGWNNLLRAEFETSQTEPYQQNISASIEAQHTLNAVSNRTLYDPATGVRYLRPENISGNWNARAHFLYNRSLGEEKLFHFSTQTSLRYANQVGYLSTRTTQAMTPASMSVSHLSALFATYPIQKNHTRTLQIGEDLELTYRRSWFDVALNTSVDYRKATTTLGRTSPLNTWTFSYGASTNVQLPWGMSLSTDIGMHSRRGYAAAEMNTNELLWNAQISQPLFQGKATLSLQWYDLLSQQSHLSRVLNANRRSDTWTNAINSYVLLHFVYKLNLVGGKGSSSRQSEHEENPPSPRGGGRGYGWGPPPF